MCLYIVAIFLLNMLAVLNSYKLTVYGGASILAPSKYDVGTEFVGSLGLSVAN